MKKTAKVLVVDDCQVIREGCKILIEKECPGFEVETIGDAEHALKRIYKNSFNIAILDVNLGHPDLDGFKLARECLLMGKPVIIYTGQSSAFAKFSFMFKNSDLEKNLVYLEKNGKDSSKELVEAVKKLIDKKINPMVKISNKKIVSNIFKKNSSFMGFLSCIL